MKGLANMVGAVIALSDSILHFSGRDKHSNHDWSELSFDREAKSVKAKRPEPKAEVAKSSKRAKVKAARKQNLRNRK